MKIENNPRFAELRRVVARRARMRIAAEIVGYVAVAALGAWTAVLTHRVGSVPPLARVEFIRTDEANTLPEGADVLGPAFLDNAVSGGFASLVQPLADAPGIPASLSRPEKDATFETSPIAAASGSATGGPLETPDLAGDEGPWAKYADDPTVRWFNGRPVRPVRVMSMVVTGYSPDAKSCGESADGITATLHSVYTNGFSLAAADPDVLPYGSLITVPGYDGGKIVPVLDCGGAIKGRRLDMLFPTDSQAMRWGKQRLNITVWRYIDGKPAENPRKLR